MRHERHNPCPCGSGSTFERCCGADPERQAALVDVENAAAFLPALRPSGAAVLSFCARVADELGENDGNAPDDLVADGVALSRRVWEPTDGLLYDRVEERHVERVRLLCDALHRHLPLPSLPRASQIMIADCGLVLRDDEQARRTAAALLLSHASYLAACAIEAGSVN